MNRDAKISLCEMLHDVREGSIEMKANAMKQLKMLYDADIRLVFDAKIDWTEELNVTQTEKSVLPTHFAHDEEVVDVYSLKGTIVLSPQQLKDVLYLLAAAKWGKRAPMVEYVFKGEDVKPYIRIENMEGVNDEVDHQGYTEVEVSLHFDLPSTVRPRHPA